MMSTLVLCSVLLLAQKEGPMKKTDPQLLFDAASESQEQLWKCYESLDTDKRLMVALQICIISPPVDERKRLSLTTYLHNAKSKGWTLPKWEGLFHPATLGLALLSDPEAEVETLTEIAKAKRVPKVKDFKPTQFNPWAGLGTIDFDVGFLFLSTRGGNTYLITRLSSDRADLRKAAWVLLEKDWGQAYPFDPAKSPKDQQDLIARMLKKSLGE